MTASNLTRAKNAFSAVFRDFDPYGRPFQLAVGNRLLIYDVDRNETTPWGLSAPALAALLHAADDQDLECVFVSVSDPRTDHDAEAHYVLSPLTADSYAAAPGAWTILPHAMYPPSGRWGVISSDESHILVGGTARFVAELAAGLGRGQDAMISAWLEDWSGHQDQDPDGRLRIGDWIPAQLAHIVGPERAERALGGSRLRRWDSAAR
jgi:hypothetical protein